MRRREFLVLAGAAAAAPGWALAQQAARPRIAYLYTRADLRDTLAEGLAGSGYVDGRNITIDYSLLATDADATSVVAGAIASRPDLIVALSAPTCVALKASGTSIPVVFADVNDPVLAGLVASYDRPGANMTGSMNGAPDLIAKRFALLREIEPALRRLAFFGQPDDPAYADNRAQAEAAARTLGANLTIVDIREGDDFTGAFDNAGNAGIRGAVFMDAPYFNSNMPAMADQAIEWRLPSVGTATQAKAGALVGLGPDVAMGIRAAAKYVDAILKGARPAELPIIQPTKIDLVVNATTARWLALTLPSSILTRATETIE